MEFTLLYALMRKCPFSGEIMHETTMHVCDRCKYPQTKIECEFCDKDTYICTLETCDMCSVNTCSCLKKYRCRGCEALVERPNTFCRSCSKVLMGAPYK